ncbi:HTH_Tnp_Tc3_2 domain-containing protein [Trichonephila clavipes]|nr:HTH_Tnp_Tc3_2 domain-containing protein [Trichonephila clavipes]
MYEIELFRPKSFLDRYVAPKSCLKKILKCFYYPMSFVHVYTYFRQSITDVALLFDVHHSVISRLWKQFQTTQTVVRRPVGCIGQGLQPPVEDRCIAIAAKRNRRPTSTRVTSMVTASIAKTISAATVRRRLHMNGLYARVPRVCVPLSVQSRGARLKWCREHGNRTVSNWGNVMFTDESGFALKPDDKRIRIWRKQGTRNQL